MSNGTGWRMNEKERQSWEITRKRGAPTYVLIWGALIFGGLLLIGDVLGAVYFSHKTLDISEIGLKAIVDCGVGVFWALVMWFMDEDRYRNALNRVESNRETEPE
jgi:hypothetical protein